MPYAASANDSTTQQSDNAHKRKEDFHLVMKIMNEFQDLVLWLRRSSNLVRGKDSGN